jgi:hypothetical protein
MRTRYEAALKAALKKGEVPENTPQRFTRHTSHVTKQEREDKLPKSLPKKDARAQINDVRAFYQVNRSPIVVVSSSSSRKQGKIKELELQVEQLQRAKEAKRPKTGTPPVF